MTEPAQRRGVQDTAASPPASYAGRTRYTQLEYDALLANLSIGIAFTRDRRFFLCNARFSDMFGYGAGELIGQAGEVVYPSRESYARLGDLAAPLLSQGRQLDLEWELKRKDGSTFIARMIAKALDSANPQQGVTGEALSHEAVMKIALPMLALLLLGTGIWAYKQFVQ